MKRLKRFVEVSKHCKDRKIALLAEISQSVIEWNQLHFETAQMVFQAEILQDDKLHELMKRTAQMFIS
jgi:hypothetical protein